MALVIIKLPMDAQEIHEEINYDESKKVYEDYQMSYTNSYVFGITKKFVIPIKQLEILVKTLNIRALEEKEVIASLNSF